MQKLETITDPVKLVWAIREQIYEETKDMTREEKRAYRQQAVDEFQNYMNTHEPQPEVFEKAKGWFEKDI
ncbi:hypothetical protein FACS189443_3040 [Planctomycetales bacterium]|nr:hypothetical protein FACS189443_3040 [Planctomycetales bacterium]